MEKPTPAFGNRVQCDDLGPETQRRLQEPGLYAPFAMTSAAKRPVQQHPAAQPANVEAQLPKAPASHWCRWEVDMLVRQVGERG